jgi:hypothetical protein
MVYEIAASQREWASIADEDGIPNLPRFMREWEAGAAERDAKRAECFSHFDRVRDAANALRWANEFPDQSAPFPLVGNGVADLPLPSATPPYRSDRHGF